MNLIVCLDDKNGLSFGGRRQSMDSALRLDIIKTVNSGRLLMNGYSRRQFKEQTANITESEGYLCEAGDGDFCFLETDDIMPYIKKIKTLTVYRWNKIYPSDKKFPLDSIVGNRLPCATTDFQGSSHEKITKEEYFL